MGTRIQIQVRTDNLNAFRIILPVVIIEKYNQEIEEILVIVLNHFYLHVQYAKMKFYFDHVEVFNILTKKNL